MPVAAPALCGRARPALPQPAKHALVVLQSASKQSILPYASRSCLGGEKNLQQGSTAHQQVERLLLC